MEIDWDLRRIVHLSFQDIWNLESSLAQGSRTQLPISCFLFSKYRNGVMQVVLGTTQVEQHWAIGCAKILKLAQYQMSMTDDYSCTVYLCSWHFP